MVTSNERASARVALRALSEDPDFAFKAPVLRRMFSDETMTRIKAEEDYARKVNKDAKEAGLDLSPEAAGYWSDVLALIARGKAAQADGDEAAVSRVNHAGERLAESFDERVPDGEKHKFKQLDPQDHERTWDDRWSYVEYDPPLLRDEFATAYTIPHVRNHAQSCVLGQIAQPDPTPAQEARSREKMLELRRLVRLDEGMKQFDEIRRQTEANKRAHLKSLTKEQKKARSEKMAEGRKAASDKQRSLKTIPLNDAANNDGEVER